MTASNIFFHSSLYRVCVWDVCGTSFRVSLGRNDIVKLSVDPQPVVEVSALIVPERLKNKISVKLCNDNTPFLFVPKFQCLQCKHCLQCTCSVC